MPENYNIETFRGDYDELERMAHASWRDEYGEASFSSFYRPAFLRYLIDRLPVERRDHVVEDLGRKLQCPDVARTRVYEKDGRITGLISFLLHDHIGRTTERWAWVNHVAFAGLSASERAAFVRTYLVRIEDEGLVGTIEWKRRNYPIGALYRNRFFPYPRGVSHMSWTFNPGLSLSSIPDVYEIQI